MLSLTMTSTIYNVFFYMLALSVNRSLANNGTVNSSSIEFGHMTTLLMAGSSVYHVEKDVYIEGNLLYSDGSSLKTSNGVTSTIVVGHSHSGYVEGVGEEARFDVISGFAQFNSTHVALVDSRNHCVRLVSRISRSTTPVVGECKRRSVNRFDFERNRYMDYPWQAIINPRNPNIVMITDRLDSQMIFYNTESGDIELNQQAFTNIRAFNWNLANDILYMANQHQIASFAYGKTTNLPVAGSSDSSASTFADGSLENSRFGNIYDILEIKPGVLLVADAENDRLRVVDTVRDQVSSICSGTTGHADGSSHSCQLFSPYSILLLDGILYIGEERRIRKIPVSGVGQPSQPLADTTRLGECPKNPAAIASSATNTGMLELGANGVSQKLELPIGRYNYILKTGFLDCNQTAEVFDHRLRRRLVFQASYDINCTVIGDSVEASLLDSQAMSHFAQIEEICGPLCRRQVGVAPMVSCSSHTLTITWATNKTYDASVSSIPQPDSSQLNASLLQKCLTLSIVVSSQVPPIVFPTHTSSGAYAEASLKSYCLGGWHYTPNSDSCV